MQVHITVNNRYNTYSFLGTKSIVLGTTTWMGSRNPFLGIMCLATGVMSTAFGLAYFGITMIRPRKFGDLSQLSFYQQTGMHHH